MVEFEDLKTHVKGNTVKVTTTILQEDGTTPEDVSTATTLLMTVKENIKQSDSNAFAQITCSLVTDGTDGKVRCIMPKETSALARTDISYRYDIQVTLANGERYTCNDGKMSFLERVTDNT